MRFLYTFLIIVLVLFSCQAQEENKKIEGVRHTVYFPKMTAQGKLIGYDTITKLLFFCGDQITCKFMYHHDSLENNVLIKSEWKQFYFTFSKGAKFGLIFEKKKDNKAEIVLADSILKLYWPTVHADSTISEKRNIVKLTYKHFNADSGILIEKYAVKDGADTATNADVTLKYSNKLMQKQFSYSKSLDSLRGMKLYYFETGVRPRYFGKKNYLMEGFNIVCFFENIPVTNKKELLYFFEQEKKMKANMQKN